MEVIHHSVCALTLPSLAVYSDNDIGSHKLGKFLDKTAAEFCKAWFTFRNLHFDLILAETSLILHGCITVLRLAEGGINTLRRTMSPKTHQLENDISRHHCYLKSSRDLVAIPYCIIKLACALYENKILFWKRRNTDFRISYIFMQAAALDSPAYKQDQHMRH